jgi:hypothetical protein
MKPPFPSYTEKYDSNYINHFGKKPSKIASILKKMIKTVLWRNKRIECVNRRIGVEKEVQNSH